jgi:hypothetical protein
MSAATTRVTDKKIVLGDQQLCDVHIAAAAEALAQNTHATKSVGSGRFWLSYSVSGEGAPIRIAANRVELASVRWGGREVNDDLQRGTVTHPQLHQICR